MAAPATVAALLPASASAPAVSIVGPDEMSRARVTEVLGAEGMRIADNGQLDLTILTDLSERFEARSQLEDLHERLAGVPVIVVAADESPSAVQAALRGGASGFVPYERVSEVLGLCVRSVVAGQISVPQERRSELQKPALTAREKQTLALVVMGMRNCEIAQQLFLAESTVKSHLSSAFSKLGVRSRSEAAALILDPRAGVGTGILTIPSANSAPSP